MTGPDQTGYWVISDDDFIKALHRAHGGENPDLVYAEMYANSHENGGQP